MARFSTFTACSIALFSLLLGSQKVGAQSFHRGTFLVSATEGSTTSEYGTDNMAVNDGKIKSINDGNRDPLSIELGLSKHWGIGITMGSDIYKVNSASYYGFGTATAKINSTMAEATIDGDYHFLVTRRADVSAFTSFGIANVMLKGSGAGDNSYQYNASGAILRTGAKARYYFLRRLGVIGMVSAFSAHCNTDGVKGNTVATTYSTSITGCAVEFGLCFRFF